MDSPSGQSAGGGDSILSPSPGVAYTFDQKYHLRWQLSRALTTQHLLTMVSITNTLMNQTIGAHQLSISSATRQRRLSSREDDSDSEGEDDSAWDNQIRAVWSQVRCYGVWQGVWLMAILLTGCCSALCDAARENGRQISSSLPASVGV